MKITPALSKATLLMKITQNQSDIKMKMVDMRIGRNLKITLPQVIRPVISGHLLMKSRYFKSEFTDDRRIVPQTPPN